MRFLLDLDSFPSVGVEAVIEVLAVVSVEGRYR
jgi:hypothetical protein